MPQLKTTNVFKISLGNYLARQGNRLVRLSISTVLATLMLCLVLFVMQSSRATACGNIELQPYQPRSFDAPHEFRICSEPGWNAIAVRPSAEADYNLRLFSDSGFSDELAASTQPTGAVDIIMIDRNHAPEGYYYLKTEHEAGAGAYDIEWATETELLPLGMSGPYTTGASSVVRSWDFKPTPGLGYRITVSPTMGNADLGIALFESSPKDSTTFYQSIVQSRAISDETRSGQSESITFTTGHTDRFGLVIWNNSLDAAPTEYVIYVDTTPPTGTLTINDNAEFTNSTSVTITVDVTDTDSGIAKIWLANEDLIWQSQEPTPQQAINWTLPPTNGLRMVFGKIANEACLTTTISDTIILDTVSPTLVISTPVNGEVFTQQPIMVSGYVTDETSGVDWLRLQVDEQNAITMSPPYEPWQFSLGALITGNHVITAEAEDRAGNLSLSTLTFTIESSQVTKLYSLYVPLLYKPYAFYIPFVSRSDVTSSCIEESSDFITSTVPIIYAGREYCGRLDDRNDYYRINLTRYEEIEVWLRNTPGLKDQLVIYNSSLDPLAWTTAFNNELRLPKRRWEYLALGAGTYYIRVYAREISPTAIYTVSWNTWP